jgi:hypothetical protein
MLRQTQEKPVKLFFLSRGTFAKFSKVTSPDRSGTAEIVNSEMQTMQWQQRLTRTQSEEHRRTKHIDDLSG